MSSSWTNPFIPLVRSKPELIAPVHSDASPESIATLASLLLARSNNLPIICELGSGSGGHLVEQAAAHPEFFYIGFELRYKRAFRTVEKAEALQLKNLFMVQGNATLLLALFAPRSLHGVYVNFPDPWEKKKWLKHRLLSLAMLNGIASRLRPDGFFSYKTDHPEYFEQTVSLLRQVDALKLTEFTHDLWQSGYSSGHITSEFERLFQSQRLPVHYLRAICLEGQ